MKKLLYAALALVCGMAHAQLTTVTASSITMGGVPIASGTVTFTPVSSYGIPIAFATGGGGLNSPEAFTCTITAGAISGTCQVPDAALTTPTNLLYSIQVTSSTGKSFTLQQVPNVSGASWALDTYGPAAPTTNTQAVQVSYGTRAISRCVTGSFYVRNYSGGQLYICVGGSPVLVGGSNGTTFQGGVLTLALTLSRDPQSDLEAATKHYVDIHASTAVAPTGTGFAHVTGGVQDGVAHGIDLSTADTTGQLPAGRIGGDPTRNATIDFTSGSLGDTSCTTPAAGHDYMCFYAGALSIAHNGAPYAAVSLGSAAPSTVAIPSAAPAVGTYSSTQSVTLADVTSGSAIHYTVDGSTPSCSSSTYASAISVASTETIKALGCETGYTSSAVASFTYTITATASAPSVVHSQTIDKSTGAGATTVTLTYATTTGHTIVANFVAVGPVSPASVTDSASNPYTIACVDSAQADSTRRACVAYSLNAASATSVTINPGYTSWVGGVIEVAGATGVDVSPTTAQSAIVFSDYSSQTVAFTTAYPNELLIATGIGYQSDEVMSGDAWTPISGVSGFFFSEFAYATQPAAGSGAFTVSFTDQGQASAQLVLGLR